MGIFRVGTPGISVPGVLSLAEQGACGSGQNAAAAYRSKVLGTGPIAYWPLNEASGTTAACLVNPAQNGTYTGAGVTVAGATAPNGDPAPTFAGANNSVNIYSAALNTAFDGDTGSAIAWGKVDTATWTDSTTRMLLGLYGSIDNHVRMYRASTDGLLSFSYKSGGTEDTKNVSNLRDPNWMCMAITWSKAADAVTFYRNGSSLGSESSLAAWSAANLASSSCAIGALNGTGSSWPWDGAASHVALWDRVLTPAEIEDLHDTLFSFAGLFAIGDSKTEDDWWVDYLNDGLESATGNRWIERPTRYAVSGWTAALAKTYIDANLAAETEAANTCTINLGANDVVALPAEATWKANYTSIIDSVRAKWPGAQIYLAKAWRRTYDAECDTIASWIDDIVATYSSGVQVGMDERVWFENGDDGATYSDDGTHYNSAGETACANAWLTGMGY